MRSLTPGEPALNIPDMSTGATTGAAPGEGTFTICYEANDKATLIESPEMNKAQVSEFIGGIGGKRLRSITRNGNPVDSETTLDILRVARVFAK
jgi:hypothetical protein